MTDTASQTSSENRKSPIAFRHNGRPNGPFRVRSHYLLHDGEVLEETVTFAGLGAALPWLSRTFARGAFASELVDETREPKEAAHDQ